MEELNRLREKLDSLITWLKIASMLLALVLLLMLDMKSDIRVNRITAGNNKTAIRVHVAKQGDAHDDEQRNETKSTDQKRE